MNSHSLKEREENLREAACIGDLEAVEVLLNRDTNVNAKHEINGWTPLHWACKRGHINVVRELLAKGADPKILTEKGESPLSLCTNPEIRKLLGGSPLVSANESPPAITPHYIKNPPVCSQVDVGPRRRLHHAEIANMPSTMLPSHNEELIFKVRIAGSADPDFIEIEIQKSQLTYESLLEICCSELSVKSSQVTRIRKLPDTRLRNDSDVKRLKNMQSLELVLGLPSYIPNISHNGYQSITSNKDQTILY